MKKPSVTKLIEMLDKPLLLKWANKIGLEGIKLEDYRNASRSRGLNYHSAIENFLKHGLLTGNIDFDNRMVTFFKDKEILGIEKPIESEYFVGRYDLKFKWNDIIYVGDFKSNKKERIFFENKLQLGAYAMVENCATCIIHIPDLIIKPVDLDRSLYDPFLIKLSELYNLREQINANGYW